MFTYNQIIPNKCSFAFSLFNFIGCFYLINCFYSYDFVYNRLYLLSMKDHIDLLYLCLEQLKQAYFFAFND